MPEQTPCEVCGDPGWPRTLGGHKHFFCEECAEMILDGEWDELFNKRLRSSLFTPSCEFCHLPIYKTLGGVWWHNVTHLEYMKACRQFDVSDAHPAKPARVEQTEQP